MNVIFVIVSVSVSALQLKVKLVEFLCEIVLLNGKWDGPILGLNIPNVSLNTSGIFPLYEGSCRSKRI